jgi:hypothetical protein
MAGDYFWECLEAFAATFAGGDETVETNLDAYEQDLRSLPDERQASLRRDIDSIVAALARLSMRLRN